MSLSLDADASSALSLAVRAARSALASAGAPAHSAALPSAATASWSWPTCQIRKAQPRGRRAGRCQMNEHHASRLGCERRGWVTARVTAVRVAAAAAASGSSAHLDAVLRRRKCLGRCMRARATLKEGLARRRGGLSPELGLLLPVRREGLRIGRARRDPCTSRRMNGAKCTPS